MLPTARTSVELFNFLISQGRSVEEMTRIAACYRLATEIYAGYHLEEGMPFVAHSVGTAGLAAALGLPVKFVGAALLHNIYTNGDYGDGRGAAVTPARRERVRRAVGEDIENLLVEFREVRRACRGNPDPAAWVADLSGNRRQLLLIEIVDRLDHLSDRRCAYLSERSWSQGWAAGTYDRLVVTAATLLGEHEVAARLAEAIEDAPAARAALPAEVRAMLAGRGSYQLLPASATRRWLPWLTAKALAQRARLGRLKRRLLGGQAPAAPASVAGATRTG